MSAIHELKKILYGVAPAISEHAIIYTGDPRPVEVVMLEVFEEVEAELAALKAERDVLRTAVEMTNTQTLLKEISVTKRTQPAVAKTMAMIILRGEMNTVDWKQINNAVRTRWSVSARERVLTMAWKIVEKSQAELRTA